MEDIDILNILKIDLQVSSEKLDAYLMELIMASKEYIEKEGIKLNNSAGDGQLVEMYAAYLYRKRREEGAQMPRMLRWALNNRLFSAKAGGG